MSFKSEILGTLVECEREYSPTGDGETGRFGYKGQFFPCVVTKLSDQVFINSGGNNQGGGLVIYVRKDNPDGSLSFAPRIGIIIEYRGFEFKIVESAISSTDTHYVLTCTKET